MPTNETFVKWQKLCALGDAIARAKQAGEGGRFTASQALEIQRLEADRAALLATVRPALVGAG